MSRRLDFEKASRNHQAKYGLSMKDEGEWMKNDAAANWLRKHETRALRKGDYRLSAQQPALTKRISLAADGSLVSDGSACLMPTRRPN